MRMWVESLLDKSPVERLLKERGIRRTRIRPHFVISFGGDGSLLAAERKFPGVPKIPVRETPSHGNCASYNLRNLGGVLDRVKSGRHAVKEYEKVEAVLRRKRVAGMNEVLVRNRNPCKSLRFSVRANGRWIENLIGDGVLVATPFGSTAYYASMGHAPFARGLMLAFNNTRGMRKPLPLEGAARVEVHRERAFLAVDNDPRLLSVGPGDVVEIRKSEKKARLVVA
jgi:NAD+ kinase